MATVRQNLAGTPPPATWAISPHASVPPAEVGFMPPALSDQIGSEDGDPAADLGRKIIGLQKKLRLSVDDAQRLAALSGHVVDLDLSIAIAIEPDGDAVVTYTHEILNLTSVPLRRIPRELWFKHATGPALKITPIVMDGRRLMIQHTHDAPHMSKFACQFATPLEPGEAIRFGYSCLGGRFVDELYWRQDVVRPTRHLTITVNHKGATLLRCAAVEELQDGSEAFATNQILWDQEAMGIAMTVTRDYLSAGQALTLRWEIERESRPA